MQHEQGDLLFVKLANGTNGVIPKEKKSSILALGETTGHMHQVRKTDLDNCDVFLNTEGRLVVAVKTGKEVAVVHEEHGPVTLTEGNWEVRIQNEYQPDGWRQVAD